MRMLSPDFAQNPRTHEDPAALITDAITELLRAHARRLIATVLETEVASVVAELKAEGASVIRNGYLPERSVTTAIGDVEVKVPRIRAKDGAGVDFTSTLVPRYLWRSKSISAWAAYAYLKGVSEADMAGELEVVIREGGQKAHPRGGLLAQERVGGELRRLGQAGSLFDAAHLHLCRRRVPADTGGQSQAVRTGDPRSRRQRQEAPRGAGRRRARVCPGLERSAPGSALSEVYGTTAHQRCWFHKSGNVLNYLPKSIQAKARADLSEIWMAPSRAKAEKAIALFRQKYEDKYPKELCGNFVY